MLSIITVTFNNLSGLKETYESILKSINPDDYCKIEWIVVDGASHDGTRDFLKNLPAHIFNIKWISEKDEGIYDAMNKGVRLSNGDRVNFLNAGDVLLGCKILEAVALGEFFDIIFCAVTYSYNGANYTRPPKRFSYCTYGMPANHQGCIYKRNFLISNPYPSRYKISADYWLNCIGYKSGLSCSYYHNPIVGFHVGGVSTTKYHRVIKDMFMVQREVFKTPIVKALFFGARRTAVMSANYLLYTISKLAK